jgi:hypothetical protein
VTSYAGAVGSARIAANGRAGDAFASTALDATELLD